MPPFHRPPYPRLWLSYRVHSTINEKNLLHWRGLSSSFGDAFQSKSVKHSWSHRAADSRITIVPRKTRKRQTNHEEAGDTKRRRSRAISPGRYRVLDMSLHASPQIRNSPWPVSAAERSLITPRGGIRALVPQNIFSLHGELLRVASYFFPLAVYRKLYSPRRRARLTMRWGCVRAFNLAAPFSASLLIAHFPYPPLLESLPRTASGCISP